MANVINRSSYPEIPTPREYNEFTKYNHLLLGHVSSIDHLESIRLKGIVPQSDGATNVEDSLPTDEKNVYLCIDSQCGFYLSRIHRELKAKGIIIIVEVPVNKLRADVNALMPKDKENIDIHSQYALWLSLSFGQCVFPGTIPARNIKEIYSEEGNILYKAV